MEEVMDFDKERRQRELHLGVLLSPDAKVWRYLDFPKFISLLENSSLHFCRSDLFKDKFEGSFTKSSVKYREDKWREHMPHIPEQHFDHFKEVYRFQKQEERKNFYINCWHMNEYESAAMWELYGIRGQSIAIQSSYRTLRELLPINQSASGQPEEGHVDIGLVQYIDYEKDPMPQIYSFDPFLRKRCSFSHEKEVRLIYQASTKSGSYEKRPDGMYEFKPSDGKPIIREHGVSFKVDLNRLIQEIYIAPDASIWLKELVESVLLRYGLPFGVNQSNLNDSPIY
nr:hypothetical protein [uncultured Desulfobacter sp.]